MAEGEILDLRDAWFKVNMVEVHVVDGLIAMGLMVEVR
jgi:hypothetical protein